MGCGKITLDDYFQIREDYKTRNKYLYLFEITSPRKFGEGWGQDHIRCLGQDFFIPTKETDENYDEEYDLALKYKDEHIKIEVKASRVVDRKSKEPLYVKALSYESSRPFTMNFQQIKPACTDVFIWVAVWRDVIKYWVIGSTEVKNSKYYSQKQHRGNIGEGQLHIKDSNIEEFSKYECKPEELRQAVTDAYERQK